MTASEEALAEAKKRADDELAHLAEEAKARLDELNELRSEAERAVGATGAAVLAAGYQKEANAETKAANLWRLIAVAAFVGATGVAIFAVAHGLSAGFDIERFFAKIALGIPILGLAYYAAHESSRHREQARVNRRVELQLASLDAYLRDLPELERHRVRAQLADGFFESGLPIAGTRPQEGASSVDEGVG